MNPGTLDLERMKQALQVSRSSTKQRGHDWDVADVIAIVASCAMDDGIPVRYAERERT